MDSALQALLAPICPTFWVTAPQTARPPVIILTKVSGGMSLTQDGWSRPRPARVQADVYGRHQAETRLLTRRLIQHLSGRTTGHFEKIAVENERDLPGADALGNVVEFRTAVDLMVHWRG